MFTRNRLGAATRTLALGSASTLLMATAAFAQREPQKPANTVEEVIVTAQKRAEDVQTVPMSVSPITAANIERLHIQNLKDVTATIPNVQINVNAGVMDASQISIRGIGVVNQPSPFGGFEVATVIDGVPAATDAYGLTDQFDVERIEVLRGPQGTLFGANTTGGVVNIIMRQPTGVNGAYGTVTIGNYNKVDIAAAANVSIIDGVLAGKVAFSHRSRDGWFTNLYNDEPIDNVNSTKIRGYLKWTPSENIDVTWASEYQLNKNGDVLLYNNNYPGEVFYRPRPEGIGFKTWVDVNNANKKVVLNNTITANVLSPYGKITSITNYATQRSNNALDFDGIDCECFSVYGTDRSYQASQELRDVFHPQQNVEVLVGGFFQQWGDFSDGISLPFVFAPSVILRGQTHMRQKTFAGFTQIYWDVNDKLRFQGGARLSWEQVWLYRANYTYYRPAGTSSKLGRNNLLGAILLPLPVGNEPNDGTADWTNWGAKLGVDYKLTSDFMAYGYVARGFKTGGFNGRVTDKTTLGPFNPEFVTTGEIGFKSNWFNDTLRLNMAAFINKWKDMQVPYSVFGAGGTLSSIILNAGRATTKGVELEAQWVPVRGLRLDGSVGYLDAVYDKFLSGSGAVCPPPTQVQPVGCAKDFSGRPLAYAPKWNYALTGSYTWDMAGGETTAMLQYTHNDKKWGSHTQSTNEALVATNLFNGNLSWDAENGRWGVALWGRNLANKTYIANALDVPPLFVEAVLGPPREFGVDLKFNF